MYSLIMTLLLMGATFAISYHFGTGQWWSLIFTLLMGICAQLAIGLIVRKKIMNIMQNMQTNMQTSAEVLRKKYENLAQRGGNMKILMDQAQKEQSHIFQEGLDYLKFLEPYKKWALFFDKQLNTLRMQFYFQMKNYKQVDLFLGKVTIAEPMACCMLMSRYYALEKMADVEKLYKKYAKRFKTKSELIYATMSWIYVKMNRIDDAISVLNNGKKATASELLSNNKDALVNGKINKFSNASLGDVWYSLQFEEMKVPKQTQQVAMQPQHRQFMANGGRGMKRH